MDETRTGTSSGITVPALSAAPPVSVHTFPTIRVSPPCCCLKGHSLLILCVSGAIFSSEHLPRALASLVAATARLMSDDAIPCRPWSTRIHGAGQNVRQRMFSFYRWTMLPVPFFFHFILRCGHLMGGTCAKSHGPPYHSSPCCSRSKISSLDSRVQ